MNNNNNNKIRKTCVSGVTKGKGGRGIQTRALCSTASTLPRPFSVLTPSTQTKTITSVRDTQSFHDIHVRFGDMHLSAYCLFDANFC